MRPTISVAPPGGNTMTTRTGFDGYDCDHADPVANRLRTNNAPNNRIVVIPFSPHTTPRPKVIVSSLRLESDLLDQLREHRDFALDHSAELFRRGAHYIQALAVQPFLYLRQSCNSHELLRELCDDRLLCLAGAA